MFWLIVELVKKWGKPINRADHILIAGPVHFIASTRTEANRKGWIIRGGKSELAPQVMEPLIWGKQIQQLCVTLPPTKIFPRIKIFERYAPKGADDKWML